MNINTPKATEKNEDQQYMNPEDSLKWESQSRPERLEKLKELVEELFPGEELEPLRWNIIERSFNVPQYGDYHKEGMFMDTHLALILQNLDKVENGEMPPEIPEDVRQKMQQVVTGNKRTLQQYALLHDISKADCLTIKFQDGTAREVTWDEWQEGLPDGANRDPQTMKSYCESAGITGISYHQGNKGHGKEGAARISEMAGTLDVPDHLIKAIEKHEVAYSFSGIGIKSYEKHLGDLTEEARDWALTASYLDTASSIRENGRPNPENFLYLAHTVHNARLFREVEASLIPEGKVLAGLDKQKVGKALDNLKKHDKKIEETAKQIIDRLKEECKLSLYDKDKLRAQLEALVTTNQISEEAATSITGAIGEDGLLDDDKMKVLRKTLGRANQLVNAALEASRQ